MNRDNLEQLMLQADEIGVRLEIISGMPVWEAHPAMKHQEAIYNIQSTIRPTEAADGCECIHLADVYVRFPDGSLKRPDISVFCRRPQEEERAITMLPEAVIEVVSKGYEAKDLELAPRFYLAQGVRDIIVFDPYTLLVLHFRHDQVGRHISPLTIELECGCCCTV